MLDLTRWRILGWRRTTLRHSTRDRSQRGAGAAVVHAAEVSCVRTIVLTSPGNRAGSVAEGAVVGKEARRGLRGGQGGGEGTNAIPPMWQASRGPLWTDRVKFAVQGFFL